MFLFFVGVGVSISLSVGSFFVVHCILLLNSFLNLLIVISISNLNSLRKSRYDLACISSI